MLNDFVNNNYHKYLANPLLNKFSSLTSRLRSLQGCTLELCRTISSDLSMIPTIIVTGPESSGKSKLLRRLFGLNIFASTSVKTTSVVVEVLFRRTKVPEPCKISTHMLGINGWMRLTRSNFQADKTGLRKIINLMKSIKAASENSDICSNQKIVIEISNPYVPNVNVIDTPGVYIDLASPQDTQATKEILNRLLIDYPDNSLFVIVHKGNSSLSNNSAMTFARENNLWVSRLIRLNCLFFSFFPSPINLILVCFCTRVM